MTPRRFLLASLLLGALAHTPSADACGGCFHPPETVQVVTDHRMVFMLSRTRTVLWDQFRYSGRPSEFSWILPIRSGVGAAVEVADNVFITAMDDLGAPIVNPAPSPFRCSDRGGGIGCGASADSASVGGTSSFDSGAGVNVYNEQVVGPYNVATVGSTDPMALRTWLRGNGYVVPDATVPVIDYYVNLHMDFVAVRLRASADVGQMRPLRVITPGYNPQLPLRMVSAGIFDEVGIVLTVIADARVESMNYPNGQLTDGDLVYDYDSPTSTTDDFLAAFNRLNQRNNNRLWLTESAQRLNRVDVEAAIRQRCNLFGGVVAPGCQQDMPASPSDTEVAFAPFGDTAYVTRMRARLGATALDRDLQIASSDRGVRARTYDYGTLRHDPCTTPSSSFEGCSTGRRAPGALYVSGLGALGIAVAARVRRRARTRARSSK